MWDPGSQVGEHFREFEQVDSPMPKRSSAPGLGLGLAVVPRIVEQLGGQLRVDSKVDQGSRFSFLIPFTLSDGNERTGSKSSGRSPLARHRSSSHGSGSSQEVDILVNAFSSTLGCPGPGVERRSSPESRPGMYPTTGCASPIRPIRIDEYEMYEKYSRSRTRTKSVSSPTVSQQPTVQEKHKFMQAPDGKLRVLIVESDQGFDYILMDVQMPILNGFEATERIRSVEPFLSVVSQRASHLLNGRIPIFVVSASLLERQRDELANIGVDGWTLKLIDFKRLSAILRRVTDLQQRQRDEYKSGHWEIGGKLPRDWDDGACTGTSEAIEGTAASRLATAVPLKDIIFSAA
ncbi:hypothetical protein EW146_g5499 [Bondarzewia mesenterica]|uniref:histidine kinase n=1 Tax=Bondarzewia mesenterica TaxID=1095465 RepID=A0A4S4LRC9_9AGAM|nr:hypothetical protein EW146_g5499 [Bondarzewia mesenterica]